MADEEIVRKYLQKNLAGKNRNGRSIMANIGIVELREIAADVGRSLSYNFKGIAQERFS